MTTRPFPTPLASDEHLHAGFLPPGIFAYIFFTFKKRERKEAGAQCSGSAKKRER